jgi:short-subunit dehydrogenase
MKQAIAILDATGENGKVIAKALAKDHRLLLFGHDRERLDGVAAEVRDVTPGADLDCLGCACEASWEADVIIIDSLNEQELVDKIKQVATQKLVIELAEQPGENNLQHLLPNSKIRQVKTSNEKQMLENIRSILALS